MKLRDFDWLTDENIDPEVVEFLRSSGFDVEDICELGWQGETDIRILRHAHSQQRVVLTHDADFGTLAVHNGEPVTGIVYVRPGHINPQFSIETLQTLLNSDPEVTPPFIVVAQRKAQRVSIRIRTIGNRP